MAVHSQWGHLQMRVCIACALGDCTSVCMWVSFGTPSLRILAMLRACCFHACVLQVGPATLLGWFRHFLALVAYTLLYAVLKPVLAVLPPKVREAYAVSFDSSAVNGLCASAWGTDEVGLQRWC